MKDRTQRFDRIHKLLLFILACMIPLLLFLPVHQASRNYAISMESQRSFRRIESYYDTLQVMLARQEHAHYLALERNHSGVLLAGRGADDE